VRLAYYRGNWRLNGNGIASENTVQMSGGCSKKSRMAGNRWHEMERLGCAETGAASDVPCLGESWYMFGASEAR
jgi:hypothetical protein